MIFHVCECVLYVEFIFQLVEYSLTNLDYTEWSKSISSKKILGTLWWRRMFPIIGLNVHPEHSHVIMAQDDCGIYVFNKNNVRMKILLNFISLMYFL